MPFVAASKLDDLEREPRVPDERPVGLAECLEKRAEAVRTEDREWLPGGGSIPYADANSRCGRSPTWSV